jgi:outer membrane protein
MRLSTTLLSVAAATWMCRPAAAAAAPSLSLADAEQSALAHQPAVRQAAGQVEAAEGRVEQARSGYLPQVTGTGIYQRTTANFVSRPGALPASPTSPNLNPSYSSTTFNFFNFGLTASQLIYDFGATSERWRAADVNRDAAQSTGRSTVAQALLAVRRAYFQARAQKELVGVAQETVGNQQKHLEQIQGFVSAGIRPEIDLATARTTLANAKVQLVNATNSYEVALATLDQVMGVPTDQRYELSDTELTAVPGEDGPSGPLLGEALQARPEVAAAEQSRRAQELTVSSLRGNYGPALSATASLTDGGTAIDRLMPNWYLGLSLSWAILQGGLTHGQVREARGTLTALAAQEDAVRLQVGVDVEQSSLGVRAAKATIVAAEEALTNARDQLRLAEARYATGLGSAVELSDAQVAYTNAEAQEVQARYGLASARAQLITALGSTK